MRDIFRFLRCQIQDLVIAVHRKPRGFVSREAGASTIVPLERCSLRISRLQMISENVMLRLIEKIWIVLKFILSVIHFFCQKCQSLFRQQSLIKFIICLIKFIIKFIICCSDQTGTTILKIVLRFNSQLKSFSINREFF